MTIPTLLTNYLAAKAHHAEAIHLFLRAAAKLARHSGGSEAAWSRACNVSGVSLADRRSLAAHREMERVLAALKTALRRESVQTRLAVAGIVLCADLPAPVNDIVEIIQRVREGR